MKLRKNILPRTAMDAGCFLLLFTFIPVTFIFVICIVLPDFHDAKGFLYTFYCVLGIFLIFNLTGNLLATMLVDSSIKTVILQPPTKPQLRKMWRFCEFCETMVPPRSWHCQTCRTCILKRDHHCAFVGYCIGHNNHRFFLFVVVYLFIGSFFTVVYGSLYFWWIHADNYLKYNTLLKLAFPLWILFIDMSLRNFYLFIYELNMVAFLYTLLLMIYHSPVIKNGSVFHEQQNSLNKYDEGVYGNLRAILGNRMHLTWLSPFIKSDLPNDGVHWELLLMQNTKNR